MRSDGGGLIGEGGSLIDDRWLDRWGRRTVDLRMREGDLKKKEREHGLERDKSMRRERKRWIKYWEEREKVE